MDKNLENSPLNELLNLEKMRKEFKAKGSKRVSKAISMVFSVFFVFAIGLSIVLHDFFGSNGVILGVAALLLVGYYTYKSYLKEYEEEDKLSFSNKYKDFYLKKYINSLGFEYAKRGKIERSEIIASSLFDYKFHTSCGNDLVVGKVDNVDFTFCDLELKLLDWEDEKTGEEYETTIFQGLFFVADFHKNAKASIIVVPTPKNTINASRAFTYDSLTDIVETLNNTVAKNGYKKIKMDNSEFNDEFSVFGADTQQTMYVLTPAFMERILRLKRLMKSPISLSFLANKIFIKIDHGYDSFEPDLNKSIISANIAPRIKAELNAMFDIVKILKLNSKIWIVRRSDEPNFL